jgi:hypothetical protein
MQIKEHTYEYMNMNMLPFYLSILYSNKEKQFKRGIGTHIKG